MNFPKKRLVGMVALLLLSFGCAKQGSQPAAPSAQKPDASATTGAPAPSTSTQTKKVALQRAGAKLETLSGSNSLNIRNQNIKPVAILYVGDHVVTNAKTEAQLGYPDGSKALVGRNSEVIISSPASATPDLDLRAGEIRALITKGKGKKYRLRIRTRSAVMGVRGTDVVVATKGDETQVHTVSGEVDVAKSSADLDKGKGVKIPAGKFSVARLGKAISPPKSFNVKGYLNKLNKRNPGLDKMMSKLDKKRYSSTAKKKFTDMAKAIKKANPKKVIPPKPAVPKPAIPKPKIKKKFGF